MNQECALLRCECNVEAESVREREQQRIAQELYDGLGQHLLLLHMNLVRLCRNISQTQPDLQESTCLVMKQLGVVMRSLLTAIRGLKPSVFETGFCAAVEWQCEHSATRFGVTIQMGFSVTDISLPKHLSLITFRALQEALNNVYQHSKASRAFVIMNSYCQNIALTIIDDGVGIPHVNQVECNLFQLAGLRERIIDLGGKVSLLSAHNSGTTVNIELPLGGRWSTDGCNEDSFSFKK